MLMNTYNRLPVRFVKGQGVWLFDDHNRSYLDALTGIAVNALGHAHPTWVASMQEQMATLVHVSNLYHIPAQERLAEKLTAISGMSHAFFCNSGCEANEAAIKLARLHGFQKGFQNPAIVVFENAFHGRTMATLSATGNSKIQKGFGPLMRGFLRAPLNDWAAFQNVVDTHPEITAVLLEPIQGEAGIIPAHPEFLKNLRQLCTERNILLMLDEVQTGMGRTGQWFAYQHLSHVSDSNFLPDVLTLAKGLGGGIPIGACLTQGMASQLFQPGAHGSTFGGNPFACTSALTVIDIIEKEKLLPHVQQMGELLIQALQNAFGQHFAEIEGISVRGQGLMIGIEWPTTLAPISHPNLAAVALEQGLLINVTHEKVIRLLPPFIFQKEHVDSLVTLLIQSLKKFIAANPAIH